MVLRAGEAEAGGGGEGSGKGVGGGSIGGSVGENGDIGRKTSGRRGQYCETSANVIDAIQEWTMEASCTIAMFASKRSADRKRRTIDFINQTKVVLRKTKPIGEEENE